jgi:two-component system, OmpR family, phosphate regulon sensor histidine kinase PhoR
VESTTSLRAIQTGATSFPNLAEFAALSRIFDAVDVLLYVADMKTHELLFLNAYGQQLWGPNAVGQLCYEVLQRGQKGPCAFCTNPRLAENGHGCSPVVWEFKNTVNNRWFLCIDKAIPWVDGRLVRMEVAIDVTERKAREQFHEQYVGLISHDLRSPLSSIINSASLLRLLLEKHGVSEGAKPVDMILRSSRRMANMIDDLLETTRSESVQLQLHKSRFDLSELTSAVLEHLGAEASRRIRFEANDPAPVFADAGRMERVLDNLIGNAFRYSSADAPVTVRIDTNEIETVVTVTDRGVGIPADALPKLFQRFSRVTTNPAIKGLGLGLYNSRLIIEGHGGRIWAQSELGVGSTFAFALPTARVGP